jgi:hypothetical protein
MRGVIVRDEVRTTLAAFATAAVLIAGTEVAYRMAGGLTSAIPGHTKVEFQQIARHVKPEQSVLVVGDSRVGWGFSPASFDTALRSAGRTDLKAVNAGLPGTGVVPTLRYLRKVFGKRRPALVVVNYSTAGFYHFGADLIDPHAGEITLQDISDDRMTTWLKARSGTYQQPYEKISKRLQVGFGSSAPREIDFVARTVYPDGMINGTLAASDRKPVDLPAYQLESYATIIDKLIQQPERGRTRREELVKLLAELKADGWNLRLVRLPTGKRMRPIEDRLPAELQPATLANELQIPFHDYSEDSATADLATVDESHLTPESAREVSRRLAEELAPELR